MVNEDLKASNQYWILTGFTSLANLVDYFGTEAHSHLEKVNIVLGFEPQLRKRKKYPLVKLPQEIREYWLRKELSILYGSSVMNLIEKIKRQEVEFRFIDRLHAKIYVGDTHAMLGSANFSKSGLETQQEANIRVARQGNGKRETQQYDDITSIARNYFDEAMPYPEIIELLQQLIRQVSWREALARAIAEVLEADWLEDYGRLFERLSVAKLWPSQRMGVARAMHVLQRMNNVLIADPTGSGKTKTCGVVQMMLIHWLWEHGRQHRANSLVVSPPQVVGNWRKEFQDLQFLNHAQLSHGILSHGRKSLKKAAEKDLSIANIVTLDEAHNYLNPTSGRSTSISRARADHMILSTATPINKRAHDLLRMIELLDVDNLSDEQLKKYTELKQQRSRTLSSTELDMLQAFVSQFLVRRTKSELSRLIDANPEAYVNRLGNRCKFPEQQCRTYKVYATDQDRQIARKIQEQLDQLKGILFLRHIGYPPDTMTEEQYADLRLRAAKALASYMIRARLRSSHVALVEHLAGARIVEEHFGLKPGKKDSGDIINKVEQLIEALPEVKIKRSLLPDWLTDEEAYKTACKEEVQILRTILKLATQLSGNRERAKAKHLLTTMSTNDLAIAFDSTVITLHYLRKLLKEEYSGTVYVVTGGSQAEQERLLEDFSLESTKKDIIALCSDAMSEGVNLQKASAVTLLDMPSVLRIAEQRIGRLDRLDSPHDSIDAWWPDDEEEFALKGDQRLIEISEMAEHLIGSNLELPRELIDKHSFADKSSEEAINYYETNQGIENPWQGFQDAFLPVQLLKEGGDPLIDEDLYKEFIGIKATIKTRVSFVRSQSDWAFFALRGSKSQSPQWVFISGNDEVSTDFPEICGLLNKYLREVDEAAWNQDQLDRFVKRLRKNEIDLLPHKRKRAITVARALLKQKLSKAETPTERQVIKDAQSLLTEDTVSGHIVDYYQLSQLWLDILQPELDRRREANSNKRNVISLQNLKSAKNPCPISIDQLEYILENCPYTESIDQKIAACIIGTQAAPTDQSQSESA